MFDFSADKVSFNSLDKCGPGVIYSQPLENDDVIQIQFRTPSKTSGIKDECTLKFSTSASSKSRLEARSEI